MTAGSGGVPGWRTAPTSRMNASAGPDGAQMPSTSAPEPNGLLKPCHEDDNSKKRRSSQGL